MFNSKAIAFFDAIKLEASRILDTNYKLNDEKISLEKDVWARISFINVIDKKSINFCLFDKSDKIELTVIDESDRNLDYMKYSERNTNEGILALFGKI